MYFLIALKQLTRDLSSQKLRTFLTVFGVVWGTAAVSLLLAFGEGFHRQVRKNSAGIGEDIIIAWPSLTSKPFEGLGKGRRIRLVEEDIDRIRSDALDLLGISGEYSSSLKLNHATRTLAVDTSGVEPAYADLRNIVPQAGGRFLNPIDMEKARRVAFLGDKLAKDLFKEEDPVGETVTLSGSPFLIIGVLKEKSQDSNYSGPDSEKVFVPASTFQALTGEKYLENFIFKAVSSDRTEALKKDVVRIIAKHDRFDPEDKEALAMWDTTRMFQFLDTFMLALRLFLGVVGSLTLVVGGIGVSNIMNVVVEERTREIGIKMALGARPEAILGQFLLETLAITVAGGCIGLALAAGLCAVFPVLGLTDYVGDPVISPLVAGVTASLLGMIGLIAGYFPARDAASLDPVVAMKL